MSATRPALAALLAAGCGTQISTTMVNTPPRAMAPHSPETVELFTSGAPLRPHVDVAYLEAEQQSGGFSVDGTPQFFRKMRVHAAAMGCDALVIGGSTNRTSVAINLRTPVNLKGLTATCIVYTTPSSPFLTVSSP